METQGLDIFITRYIEGRRQPKREAFDKEAEKRLSTASADEKALLSLELSEQRRKLENKYEVQNWLTDAAARAGQIRLVTHAIKYFHGDAKGSSVYSTKPTGESVYLTTATLRSPAIDADGNSAALDVARLLQTEHEGTSLLACLRGGDHSPLAAFAKNDAQREEWVSGFMQAVSDKTLSTHQLAKQLYFPVSETGDYHLLSPMFSSSMAHALHQRISQSRYNEDAIAARKARREGRWHPSRVRFFPELAVQNLGGTKPLNISYLNNVRGGKNHLLRCAPPQWQRVQTPPTGHATIFAFFSPQVSRVIGDLRRYLRNVYEQANTQAIRLGLSEHIDELIGVLFSYAAEIQDMTQRQGWSMNAGCKLNISQQLWLDPLRQKHDPSFKNQREGGDWINVIAEDFAHWVNTCLSKDEKLNMGAAEFNHWVGLMRRRLKEFDRARREKWQ